MCTDYLEMAYFTRSVAKPSGYYVALNSRCSADMYGQQIGTAVSLRCDDEDVDRIVAQRHTVSSHTLCFLPLSQHDLYRVPVVSFLSDYPKEDSSWVPERDITLPALQ